MERWESSELGRTKKGGGGRGLVSWEGKKIVRWLGSRRGRKVRWQFGGFLVLFKGGGRRTSPGLLLFVSDVNQRSEGVGSVQDILAWPQE